MRSEIPSSMCAKLRTMAASNNRDHARNLSYYCLLALHIWRCYSSCTSVCGESQSTQHHPRGCSITMGQFWNLAKKIYKTSIIIFQAVFAMLPLSHNLEIVMSWLVWSGVTGDLSGNAFVNYYMVSTRYWIGFD